MSQFPRLITCVPSLVAIVTVIIMVYVWLVNSFLPNRLHLVNTTGKVTVVSPEGGERGTIRFLINQPRICSHSTTVFHILFIVCIAVEQSEQRRAVRRTWGSRANLDRWDARLVFLVGMRSGRRSWEALLRESGEFGDVVQANFVESYANLTRKSLAMLKWARDFCPNARHVAKCDGDVYVNLEILDGVLHQHARDTRSILGRVYENATVNRDRSSRYFVRDGRSMGPTYPTYVSGALYILTRDLVSDLFDASAEVEYFAMEDVYITGLCASRVGRMRFINVPSIGFGRRAITRCAFRDVVSGHRVRARDMYEIHGQLLNGSENC